jgi:lipid-A-disaccharide synthase
MRYFFLAGEPSGDLHTGNLVRALRVKDPDAVLQGWGGEHMRQAGVKVTTDVNELAFMGFWEVLKNLRHIRQLFKRVKQEITAFRPDVVVLVDYPGFNLRMAKWLKKQGIKVAWYISPQLWAWRPGRAEIIRENVGLMMVILPFEEQFYADRGIKVEYVGHPLVDVIPTMDDGRWTMDGRNYVALLPGSRAQELRYLLPLMYEVARKMPEQQFVVAGRSALGEAAYRQWPLPDNVEVQLDRTYPILQQAKAAIVTSGTATLETALWQVPQVVVYKTGGISYRIARRVVQVPYISLANLIAGKQVVPELIQYDCTPERVIQALQPLLSDTETVHAINQGYALLRQQIGGPGAAEKAAGLVYGFVAGG